MSTVFAAILLGATASVHACSCMIISEYGSFLTSDLVFTGTVIDTTAPVLPDVTHPPWTARFAVNRVFRGSCAATIRVAVPAGGNGGTCGQIFIKDSTYLLFCDYSMYPGTDFYTSDCQSNRQVTSQRPVGPVMEQYSLCTHFEPKVVSYNGSYLAIVIPAYGYRPAMAQPIQWFRADTSEGQRTLTISYVISPRVSNEHDTGQQWFGGYIENAVAFPVNGNYTVRLKPTCTDTAYAAINCIAQDIGVISVTSVGVTPPPRKASSAIPSARYGMFDICGRRVVTGGNRSARVSGIGVLFAESGNRLIPMRAR